MKNPTNKWADLFFNLKSLAVVTTVATLSFGFLSWYASSNWWSGVLADLSITSLGILVTVFLIDRIVARHERRQWEGVREIARGKLKVATARAIFLIASKDPDSDRHEKFRYAYIHVRVNRLGHWTTFLEKDGWREYVLGTVFQNLDTFLPGEFDQLAEVVKPWAKSVEYDYSRLLQIFSKPTNPYSNRTPNQDTRLPPTH